MSKFPTLKVYASCTYLYTIGALKRKAFQIMTSILNKLKFIYLIFVLILVPVYWINYGPGNFLWFSDIALFAVGIALWTRSRLLISMMAVGVLILEIIWNIDFFFQLITRSELINLTNYMFNEELSLFLRGLSLFHVFLPAIVIWLLIKWGYDTKAFYYQWALTWIVLPLTYFLTNPQENINWVHGLGDKPQTVLPKGLYFALVMIAFPLAIYLPSHFVLKKLFKK
ncbi:MAG: membrane-associated protein [Bacteroidota bacterium]|nr:membrane-associated protein [Bacteroidota bacterium]